MNRCAGRRGFTLIELLLVVGLLVAIAAIALPSALDTLDRRRFEGEVDELLAQLRSAQAMARVDGTILEVRLRPVDDGAQTSSALREPSTAGAVVEVRRVDLASAPGRGGDFPSGRDDRAAASRSRADQPFAEVGMVGLFDDAMNDAPPGTLVDGSWGLCRFECTVEIALPSSSFEGEGLDGADPVTGEDDVAARAQPSIAMATASTEETPPHGWRVALFLPDGSAPMSLPLRLRDRDGRQAVIVINPFTGRAVIERADAAAAESLVDPDAEPLETEVDEPVSELDAGGTRASPEGAGTAPDTEPRR